MLDKEIIKNFVTETYLLKGVKVVEKGDFSATFISGWTSIDRKRIDLTVIFTVGFPNEKPAIILNNLSDFGLLPHVSSEGIVCFLDDEGIILNESNPEGIIYESLDHAIKTLSLSIKGENRLDFFQEFDAYFNYFDNSKIVNSICSIQNRLQIVKALSIKDEIWIGKKASHIVNYLDKLNGSSISESFDDFIYIPLKENSLKNIPIPKPKSFWTLPQIRSILFRNIDGNIHQFRKLLHKKKSAPLIVALPLKNNTNILFGFFFKGKKKHNKHPLLDTKSKSKVIPLKFNRMDETYLLNRGGSNTGLSQKKVLVIGCGSIGGVISVELAKAGILNLTLVDNDKLSKDNLYRHVLGCSSGIGSYKVDSLKKEIEGKLPLTKIHSISKKIQDIIEAKELDFSEIDLVINATGIPNVNFIINDFFIKNYPNLSVVTSWVEPLGVGGHTIVSNNKQRGCYRCLFTEDQDIGLYNEYLFTAPNQSFRKSISGCESRFTPFSSLDATRSAIETVRIAVEILKGKEIDNPFVSWKGVAETFYELGYKTTERFEQTVEDLFNARYDYKKKGCQGCN